MPTRSPDPAASDADLDADLDVPAPPPVTTPRLRRSARTLTTGVALLACQQVLSPVVTVWALAGETGPSHHLSDAVTAGHVVVFGIGLVLLLVGLHRSASHLHALAVAAQQR